MTDKKISELSAMTSSEIANDDEIVISDTSATHTKKTPISELSTFFGINPEGQRDVVGAMFTAGSHSGVTVTYDDPNDSIDIVLNGSVTDAELGHLNGVTSDIQTQINGKAGLASPAFTGNPTAPTQTADNNSTRIATTSYVQSELTNYASDSATFTNKGGAISQWTNDSGFMTASSTNTLTNKSGNISQWTNNSNYETPTSTATLQNKTISGSDNTISNLPYSAISGVADEDLSSVSASHDTIPTAKATKAYVDAQISGIDTVAEAGDTSITSPSSGQILVHDGSDSFDNKTASVTLTGAVTGTANMSATGAVSVATTIPTNTITINGQAVSLGGSATIPSVLNSGGTFIGEVHLNDDVLLSFGGASGSGDFSISHESSTGDTILAEGGSGNLKILASNLEIRNANNSQHYITANDGGDTILYKAGSERARTSTNGFNVTGDIAVTGTVDGVDVASLNTTVGNLATVATSGAYGDLSGSPTLATVATSGAYGDLSGTPTLATVATSGAYSDLSGTPTIPSAVTNNNQLTNGAGYITSVSGNITQLSNNAGYVTSSGVTSVATGNGLTGGTITSTGTVSMSGSYSGSYSVSGNLTAYSSDIRLKNFKGQIENALDKVDKLSGHYFEWNDTAKGIDAEVFKDGVEVGVIAQEVEQVMPEVVVDAPIVKIHNLDTDYKTVHYDKLVPLLIEAIKELKGEVEELKTKLCECKD